MGSKGAVIGGVLGTVAVGGVIWYMWFRDTKEYTGKLGGDMAEQTDVALLAAEAGFVEPAELTGELGTEVSTGYKEILEGNLNLEVITKTFDGLMEMITKLTSSLYDARINLRVQADIARAAQWISSRETGGMDIMAFICVCANMGLDSDIVRDKIIAIGTNVLPLTWPLVPSGGKTFEITNVLYKGVLAGIEIIATLEMNKAQALSELKSERQSIWQMYNSAVLQGVGTTQAIINAISGSKTILSKDADLKDAIISQEIVL